MNLFVDTICQRTCHALEELDPNGEWKTSEIKALIEQPPDAEMGDFALPCFSFSKKLRRSPKQIAEELGDLLAPEHSEDHITDFEELLPFPGSRRLVPTSIFFSIQKPWLGNCCPPFSRNPQKGIMIPSIQEREPKEKSGKK